LLIVVFPILYTAYISFTNMNVYHWFNFSFVGLKNYKDALFVFDSGFLAALLRTILWTVLNMVLQLVIAFVLASLLNIQDFKGRRVYKTLLMILGPCRAMCRSCSGKPASSIRSSVC
jgi:arabinogalactan oligomer/maltooligosaccharide transport system permease protein